MRDLRRARPRPWRRLDHPVLLHGFDAVLDGEHPHLLLEHLEGPTLPAGSSAAGPRSRSSSSCRWPCTSRRCSTTSAPRRRSTST